jgi:transcription elongation factor Elf1
MKHKTYSRVAISRLVTQKRVKRTNNYTLPHPTVKSVSTILDALSECVGCIKKEMVRTTTSNLQTIGFTTVTIVGGKFSHKVIPVVQYVVDYSGFAYLESKQSVIDWLKSNNNHHIKVVQNLYSRCKVDNYDKNTITIRCKERVKAPYIQ